MPSVKNIDEILHNIADHTETLLRLLNQPGLDEGFRQRMLDHIGLEEAENAKLLEELHSSSPNVLTQKLLDHSFFIKKMISDPSIPLDLKQELLDHFGEEHREWQAERALRGGAPMTDAHRAGENRSRKGGVGGTKAARYLTDYMHSLRSDKEKDEPESLDNPQAAGKPQHTHRGGGHVSHAGRETGSGAGSSTPQGTPRQVRSWTVGPMWPQGG